MVPDPRRELDEKLRQQGFDPNNIKRIPPGASGGRAARKSRPISDEEYALAREVFERAIDKPYDDFRADWDAVLKLLNLEKPCYQPAVHEALKEGRWRESRVKNPVAYIATVAVRKVLQMDLLPFQQNNPELGSPHNKHEVSSLSDANTPRWHTSDDDMSDGGRALDGPTVGDSTDHRPILAFEQGSNPDLIPNQTDKADILTWKNFGSNYDYDTDYIKECLPEKYLIPDEVASEGRRVAWWALARDADLDEGERYILTCRLLGMTRDEILNESPRALTDRLQMQAAYRRFTRKRQKLIDLIQTEKRKDEVAWWRKKTSA